MAKYEDKLQKIEGITIIHNPIKGSKPSIEIDGIKLEINYAKLKDIKKEIENILKIKL
ncbi:MAG: hypothetical protein ACTSRZ_01210 [Promethearchaeota archaeon]